MFYVAGYFLALLLVCEQPGAEVVAPQPADSGEPVAPVLKELNEVRDL